MTPKILFCVIVLTCCASSQQQVYQATGVEHRAAQSGGDYEKMVAATTDILPEITKVFQGLSQGEGRANPSDPAYIQRMISAFMPLSRKTLSAYAEVEGTDVQPETLERLNAAEAVMPSVFRFMEDLKGMTINDRTMPSGTAYTPSNTRSQQPMGVLEPEASSAGDLDANVAATLELLPEMTSIFQQIGSDPSRSNPSDPKFLQKIITAFMPFTKKALVAAAKSEGREVKQEEFDRLDAAEAVMPAVFDFMDSMRDSDFFDTQTNLNAFQNPAPASYATQSTGTSVPSNLPSAFEPAPQSSNIDNAPVASPVVSYVRSSNTPQLHLKSPGFPKASSIATPQIYTAQIPAVPYYTYGTHFGRR